jgi:glucose-6-phosphate 1-dehydrogenase
MGNPFVEGENRIIRPPSTILVIFGASGDLTNRKLIPALANLAQDDYLPGGFIVIGASRTPLSDEAFRDKLRIAVQKHSRQPIKELVWAAFAENIFYQALDGTNPDDFKKLKERLEDFGRERQEHFNYLYYFATSPKFFGEIAGNLRQVGLVEQPGAGIRRTSIVVEKPFGYDVPSARALNDELRENLAEEQIFRIDHYLGKETVQNILVFRFGNGIFEPLWNSRYIDCIQISVCEDIGVGSRADYFDQNGILRDIVQNHVLQMLSLLCIEPPLSLSDADSIRDEKVKVLKMVKRLKVDEVPELTVRGRYSAGFINGEPVPAYLEEAGIAPQSRTETYVALKLGIDNWRWAGVPIYIRAGKRLPKRITEISVMFKRPPGALFHGRQVTSLTQNVLSIQVQPHEGISLSVNSKPPGPRIRVRTVNMDFTYDDSFGIPSPDAYERLLLDAMKGDATLFTRDDEIKVAWDLLTPVLESWSSSHGAPLYEYNSGSWGPDAADALLAPAGHQWRSL